MSNFLLLSEDGESYIVSCRGKANFFFPFSDDLYIIQRREKKICTMVIDTHFDKRERERERERRRGTEREH